MSFQLFATWDYQKQGSGTAATPTGAYNIGLAAYKASPWLKGLGDARNYTKLLWDINKYDNRIVYDQSTARRNIIRQPASPFHIKYQKSVLLSATYSCWAQADMYETFSHSGNNYSTLSARTFFWNTAQELNTQPAPSCLQLVNFRTTATDQPVNDPSGAWELNGAYGALFPTLPQYTPTTATYNISAITFTNYFWVIRSISPMLATDLSRPANFVSSQQSYFSGENIITIT